MVHRGAFFAQLKTTTVRKLLPESWGFLCPVHTPDGSPCGLLNHFSHKCKLATRNLDTSAIPSLVASLGVSSKSSASLDASVVVQLDGRVLGYCHPKQSKVIADVRLSNDHLLSHLTIIITDFTLLEGRRRARTYHSLNHLSIASN
jgi:DNA-directed RNA polymerase I subunit RPA2